MTEEDRASSFDELTRGLASGSISRGRALRLMGAALVGGTLASLGIGEAAADPIGCKRNGKHCTKDKVCCSGNCDSVSGTCADAPPTCGAIGATCTGNTDCCSGRCASGMCAEPCPAGRVLLSNGTCALPCGAGLPICPSCRSDGLPSCAAEAGTGRPFCQGDSAGTTCTTTNDCSTGQLCLGGVCFVAC
jgi:hypothetical protein